MTVVANASLANQVKTVLLPFLGQYSSSGAKAWRAVQASGPLVNEGLSPTQVTGGCEAVLGLFPSPDYEGRYEFSEAGVMGVLHYELVLIGWTAPTFPAYQALITEFPLLTSNAARRPRLTPGSDDFIETLTLFLPFLT